LSSPSSGAISKKCCLLGGDRGFESLSLQQRVHELSVPERDIGHDLSEMGWFYGFIGGEANQWYPTLYEGTTPVEPKKTPEEGYHFMAV